MNEWPELGGGEKAMNDRKWVALASNVIAGSSRTMSSREVNAAKLIAIWVSNIGEFDSTHGGGMTGSGRCLD